MYGFTGKILHVDLDTLTTSVEQPDEQFYRDYAGGSLMGLYYLWKHSPAGIDAFDSRNTLTFALSAPTGLPISGQSRCTATCKSPSTGGVADSQAGGFWPAELKFAGYDAVVIRGAAETPVYLTIIEGEAAFHSAEHLWGKTTLEVDKILQEELDDKKIEIAQIGIAGEKLANFAAVMNMANRAWGRTGIGAVMGSKKLKAIVVRGTRKVETPDSKRTMAVSKLGAGRFKENFLGLQGFGKYGTAGAVMGQQKSGGLPTNNWDAGVFANEEDAVAIGGVRLYDEILRGAADEKQERKGRDTCYACVIRCKRVVESEYKDKKLIPEYGGPEYESLATFGSYCGVNDLHALTYANQLCNEYGVDTISCGATISWAMECFENGVLTLDETDGIDLSYGNADGMIAMLEKTLNREGFGDVLADGSAKAADRLGKGHDYLLTVKGQELPAHMPHVKRSLGLVYAANPFGADHQSSEHDTMYHPKPYERYYKERLSMVGLTEPQHPKAMNPEKVTFALQSQYTYSATDTLSICQFVYGASWQLYGPDDMAELMSASTGWDVDIDWIQAIGRKRLNLMRAYNAREGLTRDDDTLPKKLFRKALEGGRSDGVVLEESELTEALDLYYEQAGWDKESGAPTRATLTEIGLAWVADDLYT